MKHLRDPLVLEDPLECVCYCIEDLWCGSEPERKHWVYIVRYSIKLLVAGGRLGVPELVCMPTLYHEGAATHVLGYNSCRVVHGYVRGGGRSHR